MRRHLAFLAFLLSACPGHAAPLSGAERTKIIDTVIDRLHASYIDAEQAGKVEAVLRHADFSLAASGEAFAEAVTASMQEVTRDQHLRLLYSAQPVPERRNGSPTSAEIAKWQASLKNENYGIDRVERLPGNIGYLKTSYFAPVAESAPSIAAAMTLLAHTDALIVDLRDNGGGAADAVPLLASYLFDERTRLGDLYRREGNVTEQQWTSPAVAGSRFGASKEVYILTSKATFSGAEGFSYALKNLKRAKIVGETTRGGAHPSRMNRLDAHYELMVPVSIVRDAVTGKDWEGVGVEPDLAVPAGQALATAQVAILKKLLASQPNAESADQIRKRLAELEPGPGH